MFTEFLFLFLCLFNTCKKLIFENMNKCMEIYNKDDFKYYSEVNSEIIIEKKFSGDELFKVFKSQIFNLRKDLFNKCIFYGNISIVNLFEDFIFLNSFIIF